MHVFCLKTGQSVFCAIIGVRGVAMVFVVICVLVSVFRMSFRAFMISVCICLSLYLLYLSSVCLIRCVLVHHFPFGFISVSCTSSSVSLSVYKFEISSTAAITVFCFFFEKAIFLHPSGVFRVTASFICCFRSFMFIVVVCISICDLVCLRIGSLSCLLDSSLT